MITLDDVVSWFKSGKVNNDDYKKGYQQGYDDGMKFGYNLALDDVKDVMTDIQVV